MLKMENSRRLSSKSYVEGSVASHSDLNSSVVELSELRQQQLELLKIQVHVQESLSKIEK